MFSRRRKSRSQLGPHPSVQPPDQDSNALLAATKAFTASSLGHNPDPRLSSSAAAAALKYAAAQPPNPVTVIGNIPTKRMLERKASYSSSVGSVNGGGAPVKGTPHAGGLQKSGSSASFMSERRFRDGSRCGNGNGSCGGSRGLRRTRASLAGAGIQAREQSPPPVPQTPREIYATEVLGRHERGNEWEPGKVKAQARNRIDRPRDNEHGHICSCGGWHHNMPQQQQYGEPPQGQVHSNTTRKGKKAPAPPKLPLKPKSPAPMYEYSSDSLVDDEASYHGDKDDDDYSVFSLDEGNYDYNHKHRSHVHTYPLPTSKYAYRGHSTYHYEVSDDDGGMTPPRNVHGHSQRRNKKETVKSLISPDSVSSPPPTATPGHPGNIFRFLRTDVNAPAPPPAPTPPTSAIKPQFPVQHRSAASSRSGLRNQTLPTPSASTSPESLRVDSSGGRDLRGAVGSGRRAQRNRGDSGGSSGDKGVGKRYSRDEQDTGLLSPPHSVSPQQNQPQHDHGHSRNHHRRGSDGGKVDGVRSNNRPNTANDNTVQPPTVPTSTDNPPLQYTFRREEYVHNTQDVDSPSPPAGGRRPRGPASQLPTFSSPPSMRTGTPHDSINTTKKGDFEGDHLACGTLREEIASPPRKRWEWVGVGAIDAGENTDTRGVALKTERGTVERQGGPLVEGKREKGTAKKRIDAGKRRSWVAVEEVEDEDAPSTTHVSSTQLEKRQMGLGIFAPAEDVGGKKKTAVVRDESEPESSMDEDDKLQQGGIHVGEEKDRRVGGDVMRDAEPSMNSKDKQGFVLELEVGDREVPLDSIPEESEKGSYRGFGNEATFKQRGSVSSDNEPYMAGGYIQSSSPSPSAALKATPEYFPPYFEQEPPAASEAGPEAIPVASKVHSPSPSPPPPPTIALQPSTPQQPLTSTFPVLDRSSGTPSPTSPINGRKTRVLSTPDIPTVKHDPPPRSVSPGKSAMKKTISNIAPHTSPSSPVSKRKEVTVAFSDAISESGSESSEDDRMGMSAIKSLEITNVRMPSISKGRSKVEEGEREMEKEKEKEKSSGGGGMLSWFRRDKGKEKEKEKQKMRKWGKLHKKSYVAPARASESELSLSEESSDEGESSLVMEVRKKKGMTRQVPREDTGANPTEMTSQPVLETRIHAPSPRQFPGEWAASPGIRETSSAAEYSAASGAQESIEKPVVGDDDDGSLSGFSLYEDAPEELPPKDVVQADGPAATSQSTISALFMPPDTSRITSPPPAAAVAVPLSRSPPVQDEFMPIRKSDRASTITSTSCTTSSTPQPTAPKFHGSLHSATPSSSHGFPKVASTTQYALPTAAITPRTQALIEERRRQIELRKRQRPRSMGTGSIKRLSSTSLEYSSESEFGSDTGRGGGLYSHVNGKSRGAEGSQPETITAVSLNPHNPVKGKLLRKFQLPEEHATTTTRPGGGMLSRASFFSNDNPATNTTSTTTKSGGGILGLSFRGGSIRSKIKEKEQDTDKHLRLRNLPSNHASSRASRFKHDSSSDDEGFTRTKGFESRFDSSSDEEVSGIAEEVEKAKIAREEEVTRLMAEIAKKKGTEIPMTGRPASSGSAGTGNSSTGRRGIPGKDMERVEEGDEDIQQDGQGEEDVILATRRGDGDGHSKKGNRKKEKKGNEKHKEKKKSIWGGIFGGRLKEKS